MNTEKFNIRLKKSSWPKQNKTDWCVNFDVASFSRHKLFMSWFAAKALINCCNQSSYVLVVRCLFCSQRSTCCILISLVKRNYGYQCGIMETPEA